MRCLIIDNYDSFTWNLADYVAQVFGSEPLVVRNDQYAWREKLLVILSWWLLDQDLITQLLLLVLALCLVLLFGILVFFNRTIKIHRSLKRVRSSLPQPQLGTNIQIRWIDKDAILDAEILKLFFEDAGWEVHEDVRAVRAIGAGKGKLDVMFEDELFLMKVVAALQLIGDVGWSTTPIDRGSANVMSVCVHGPLDF